MAPLYVPSLVSTDVFVAWPARIRPTALLFSPLIEPKVHATASNISSQGQYPHYTDAQGKWQWFDTDEWTTGFFPSTLYAIAERHKLCQKESAEEWFELARKWSTSMLQLTQGNNQAHDQGFLSFPFVHELQANPGNQMAIDAVNAFADILAKRFSPIVGCTRSWDLGDPAVFLVIIDNMMNLEVLFESAEFTGNNTLRDIAIKHADTVIQNHIREDGSTWHVIKYNQATGEVIGKVTSQGYSDDSTWSRGQAWGIYGFALMFERTKFERYLETSRRLADYFIQHIPSDGIVPWDFQGPTSPDPRPADSSAAMIAGNALLKLADVETDKGKSEKWLSSAIKIINDNVQFAWNESFESLLSDGTVHLPKDMQKTGIVYGDYYFLHAGNELLKKGLAKC